MSTAVGRSKDATLHPGVKPLNPKSGSGQEDSSFQAGSVLAWSSGFAVKAFSRSRLRRPFLVEGFGAPFCIRISLGYIGVPWNIR